MKTALTGSERVSGKGMSTRLWKIVKLCQVDQSETRKLLDRIRQHTLLYHGCTSCNLWTYPLRSWPIKSTIEELTKSNFDSISEWKRNGPKFDHWFIIRVKQFFTSDRRDFDLIWTWDFWTRPVYVDLESEIGQSMTCFQKWNLDFNFRSE